MTEDDLAGDDGTVATEYDCNGEMVAVPDPFPAEGVTCDFEVDGRYWTGFDRSDPGASPARDMAWSGPLTHSSPSSVSVRRRTAPCSWPSVSPHCSPASAWCAR